MDDTDKVKEILEALKLSSIGKDLREEGEEEFQFLLDHNEGSASRLRESQISRISRKRERLGALVLDVLFELLRNIQSIYNRKVKWKEEYPQVLLKLGLFASLLGAVFYIIARSPWTGGITIVLVVLGSKALNILEEYLRRRNIRK